MLKDGELDLVNNVSKTEDREQYYAFSSLSAGENCAYLAMRADDTRVAYEDFESFPELTVGIYRGSHYNELFQEFCKEHGCMPNLVYYDTREEVEAAFETGKVDAEIITSTLGGKVHIIAKFAPESYYFATTKENTELIKELDNAMNNISTNDPYFEDRLYQKYYSSMAEENLVLSKAEREYLRQIGRAHV